jgi:hypothetical protein
MSLKNSNNETEYEFIVDVLLIYKAIEVVEDEGPAEMMSKS